MPAMLRNSKNTYRLLVDPERITTPDTVQGWILDILVKAGGTLPRDEMVRRFTNVLKRRRPKVTVRATSVLSAHQRILKDMKMIQITGDDGRPIQTRKRVSLVK